MSDLPITGGVCADCERPRSHHPNLGPCTTDNEKPCHGYRDCGVVCGCDCGCSVVLTEGNVMREDVTDEVFPPWDQNEADERVPVELLICANCYVGSHRERSA